MSDTQIDDSSQEDDSVDESELDRRIQQAEFILAREQALMTARGAVMTAHYADVAESLGSLWHSHHEIAHSKRPRVSEGCSQSSQVSAHHHATTCSPSPPSPSTPNASNDVILTFSLSADLCVGLLSILLETCCAMAHLSEASLAHTSATFLHANPTPYHTAAHTHSSNVGLHHPAGPLLLLLSQVAVQSSLWYARMQTNDIHYTSSSQSPHMWMKRQSACRCLSCMLWALTATAWALNWLGSSTYLDAILGISLLRISSSMGLPLRPVAGGCVSWVAAQFICRLADAAFQPPVGPWGMAAAVVGLPAGLLLIWGCLAGRVHAGSSGRRKKWI